MKQSVFIKMLVAFSVINAAALFIASIITFENSSSIIEDKIASFDKSLLSRAVETMDSVSAEIDNNLIQLALDDNLNVLVKNNISITPDFIGSFYAAVERVFLLKNLNENIDKVLIYSDINKMVISSEKEYYSNDLGNAFSEISDNTWRLYRGGNPSLEKLLGKNSLVYTKGIPIFGTISYGKVFVIMNGKNIGSMINSSLASNDGVIYILDGQMQPVDPSRQPEEWKVSAISDTLSQGVKGVGFTVISEGGYEYAVSWQYAPKMDWYYVKMTSMENFFKSIETMRTTVIVITLIITCSSMIVIWIVTTGLYSPIIRLIKKITGGNAYFREILHDGEIRIISEAFDAINRDKKKVSQLLWSNEEIIRKAYVLKLVRGILPQKNEELVVKQLSEFGFEPRYSGYYVMYISFDHYSDFCNKYSETDRDLFTFSVDNISRELLSEENITISCENSSNGLWILINTEAEKPDKLLETGSRLIEFVSSYFKLSVSVSVSRRFKSICETAHACKEAADAMAERFVRGAGTVIAATGAENSNRQEIPAFNADLIVSALFNPSVDIFALAESICEHIRTSGVTNQTKAVIWLLELLKRAEQRIYKKTGEEFCFLSSENELAIRVNNETIERMYLFLTTILGSGRERFTQSEDKCNYYIKMAVEIIKRDYAKDISLDMIAGEIGFTSSYFSTLFKQEMGESYINYLNKYRVSQAKQMMKEKNTTVCDVARMAGFSSSYSFIRTFKKYEGMTPGEYKALL